MQMQNQIWKGHLSTSNLTQAVLPLMEAALKGFTSSSCSEVKGQSSAEVLKENSTLGGKDTFMPDSILRNVNIQSKVKSAYPGVSLLSEDCTKAADKSVSERKLCHL